MGEIKRIYYKTFLTILLAVGILGGMAGFLGQGADAQTVVTNKKTLTSTSKTVQSASQFTITKMSGMVEISVSVGNIRKLPGTDQPILEKAPMGMIFQAIGYTTVNGDTWYEIQLSSTNTAWVAAEIVQTVTKPSVLLNAPIVRQMPELPRGCEVTSLDMLIEQAGKTSNKLKLAKQISSISFMSNGLNGNPNDGFVGDMYSFSKPGYGVYHKPIETLAKNYLPTAVDLTGSSWTAVEQELAKGHAVWVINNVTFKPLAYTAANRWYTWKTKEGTIRVTYKEHSVLVTGYNSTNVYINDPLTGKKNQAVNKTAFIEAWEQMGSQAISY